MVNRTRKEDVRLSKTAKFFTDVKVVATGLTGIVFMLSGILAYAGDSRYVLKDDHSDHSYLLRVDIYHATELKKEIRGLVNEIADLNIDLENSETAPESRGIRKKLIRKKAQLKNLKE